MKGTKNKKTQTLSKPKPCSLKVIKTCKIMGKINVTVKLIMTPPATPSKPKTLNSIRSSPGLEYNLQDSYTESLSQKDSMTTQDPSDFIEPPQNLSIPSFQEYIQHTSDQRITEPIESLTFPRNNPLKPPLSPKLDLKQYQNLNIKIPMKTS
ncbi:hypothetical protein SteCoe_27834 [Stentor coeruleus]|uniref:Uncharacterized protein n=1 Tax=Stentor coeruleus TaxID=5963 RepID=A0A1R2B9K0_9CILI|nr:hypothetical protein SteCoe_27834 [Stentor coeruleus]